MERKLILPEQRNYQKSLELALKLVKQKLTSVNMEEQCQKAGAQLKLVDDKKAIILEYLNQSYKITLPEMDVSPLDCQEPIQPRERLLMLHYLTRAEGSPITGKKITYKEVPGGATYFPTFYKRAIKPLLDNFSQEPHRLLDAAAKFNGYEADFGDTAVIINAFSRVPLILVLWHGDDELAPEGNILFDNNISGYLSAEDITVLCEIVAWKLVKISKEMK